MIAALSLCVCLSIRLSVCLSVTSWHCTKIAKRMVMQTTPYDNQWTLSFLMSKISVKFQRRLPLWGRQIEVALNWQFSTNISETGQDRT